MDGDIVQRRRRLDGGDGVAMGDVIEDSPWDGSGDTIEIDGKEWPGFATVSVRRANKWDDKKSKGEHTGERDFTGADAAKVSIKIRVWTAAQRAYIDETLLKSVEPEPGKTKVGPVSVKHSVFTSRKVSAMTIDDVDGWERSSFDEAILTINAQEYRPPIATNATGKASGTTSNGGGGGEGTHNTPCNVLLAQYNVERNAYFAFYNQALIEGQDSDAAKNSLLREHVRRSSAGTHRKRGRRTGAARMERGFP